MTNLAGIYPPIPTPFNSDETIALDKLASNLQRWLEEPLDGVVMPGSNSEAAFLSQRERIEVWRVCGEVLESTRKRFIAGTGAETTAETIELTQTAAKLGAEAALVLPPFFYKPALSHAVLVKHYQVVADASPIPLLLYNVPAFTGIDFSTTTLLELTQHPRIIGAKDSSSNIVKMTEVLAERPNFQLFAGSASSLLPFLSVGAVGGIMALANIAARPLRRLLEAFQTNRIEEARHIQLSLVRLNGAITVKYGVSGLKYAMDQVGLHGGATRRPLLPLHDAQKAEIDDLLAKLALLD